MLAGAACASPGSLQHARPSVSACTSAAPAADQLKFLLQQPPLGKHTSKHGCAFGRHVVFSLQACQGYFVTSGKYDRDHESHVSHLRS